MEFLRHDLSQLRWKLAGWAPHAWRLRKYFSPEIAPITAKVPGSVHAALLKAGVIEDWTKGTDCYKSEWVEHRHWEFTTTLPAKWFHDEKPVWLNCQGLDYYGKILIDDEIVDSFQGTFIPRRFELTSRIQPGKSHKLTILFEGVPEEHGQFGFTRETTHVKPRFCYGWDWCVRTVGQGVWDDLWLETGEAPRFLNVRPVTQLGRDLRTGQVSVECDLWNAEKANAKLVAQLKSDGTAIASVEKDLKQLSLEESTVRIKLPKVQVEPWYPNGLGEPKLYSFEVILLDENDEPIDSWTGRVGFKRVKWSPCKDAAKDALPWICEVNGKPIFLQGVNWTPIKIVFHDVKEEEYRKRILQYREMGCNVLRVWGGGLIEKRCFYELCDEMGLLVWQEFPLSSSGNDNTPPFDSVFIERIAEVAEWAVKRRGWHVSRLIWCGGNELQSGEDRNDSGRVRPWDESHPCLKALGDVVRRLDSQTRYLPTSPYGPYANALPARFGQGVHHSVNGPWNLPGTWEEWCDYWKQEDSLFRGEVGVPSASPYDILCRYQGSCSLWPVSSENPFWRKSGSWWINTSRFEEILADNRDEATLKRYVKASQKFQAKALAYAANAYKKRYPATAGFIVWMGHDTFPCGANNSLLDYHGRPKPAARDLAKVFKTPVEELKDRNK